MDIPWNAVIPAVTALVGSLGTLIIQSIINTKARRETAQIAWFEKNAEHRRSAYNAILGSYNRALWVARRAVDGEKEGETQTDALTRIVAEVRKQTSLPRELVADNSTSISAEFEADLEREMKSLSRACEGLTAVAAIGKAAELLPGIITRLKQRARQDLVHPYQ